MTRRHALRSPGWAITGVLIGLAVFGCGDDKGTGPGNGTDGALTFTRADSSRIDFPSSSPTYVWCDDWEPGEVSDPALHVFVVGPGQESWWLRAVLRDVNEGGTFSFPNHFTWDSPDSVHIFLLDDPNELATDTEDSRGTITFHRLPCSGGDTVAFSIDAVLGSELGDMPGVFARGGFTAKVTSPPPWWGRGRPGVASSRADPGRAVSSD